MGGFVIPSYDYTEGVIKLERILVRAEEYGLRIKWDICDFLGFIIKDISIKPFNAKTKAIKNFPLPHDPKATRRFMGLTSYFKRLVDKYALIAKLLSDLLIKEA